MRKLFTTLAFGVSVSLLVAGLTGCQTQARRPMAEVPPPAFDENEDFEPVEVDDYDDQPVAVDEADDAQSPEQPTASGNTYTVQRGDTLWSIANDHYGDGQRWQDIVKANPGLNSETLAVGQQITLPE